MSCTSIQKIAQLIALLGLMLVASINVASADVLSLNAQYAYYVTLPGQNPGVGPHYLDDTHVSVLGQFSTGQLTDGQIFTAAQMGTSTNNQAVGFYGPTTNVPDTEIVFDLGSLHSIESITIGAADRNCCGSGVPDDVFVSFSSDTATTGYGAEEQFDLWAVLTGHGPHDEMTIAAMSDSAQFVKLRFTGGNLGIEKYMLDEITINGGAPVVQAVPEPVSLLSWSLLIGVGLIWRRRCNGKKST